MSGNGVAKAKRAWKSYGVMGSFTEKAEEEGHKGQIAQLCLQKPGLQLPVLTETGSCEE